MRTILRRVGLTLAALAALVAVAGCAPTPGNSGVGTGTDTDAGAGTDTDTGPGTGTVGGVGGGGSAGGAGGNGGGTPVDDGPWPVVINGGKVGLKEGKFCGGPTPTMIGAATVSVANGPVTVKVVWRPADGGTVYGESKVEFTGTGAQSKDISVTWGRSWGTSGTVRISYADLVPGAGQQASQYIPPNPLDIDYQVPQCTKPDLSVKILAVNAVPQPCPLGHATAVAQVTLASELSEETSGFHATLVWSHPLTGTEQSMDLTFSPGGPTVLNVPTAWAGLQAPRSYVAKAQVHVERPSAPNNPYKYQAPDFAFVATCVNN